MTISRRHITPVFPEPEHLEFGPEGERIDLSDGWRLVSEAAAAQTLLEEYAKLLGVPSEGDGKPIRLIEKDLPGEAYSIDFSQTEGVIGARTTAGFRYALQTLRQLVSGGQVRPVRIEDKPQLNIRGLHRYLHKQCGADEVKGFIEAAGRSKLNTIIPEYFSRFPYRKHGRVRRTDAFSEADVREFVELAGSRGIEIIPLQQSLGHLGYLLRHDAYADIREESEAMDEMCPLNPKSFDTFVELAEEVLGLHPEARFFHVGGDETWRLGTCPKCRQETQRLGRGALYGTHMKKVLEWVVERGLRPIIWSDMLCRYPDALQYIPTQTIIMVWEYWTVSDPTPVLEGRCGRYGKPAFIHDKRWGKEWPLGELTDLQRIEMLNISFPFDVEAELSGRFMDEFGKYLGDDFPKFFRAFPYLEYFQDKGYDVIAAPTAMGGREEVFGTANFERFFHNLHTFSARCKENGCTLGLINTFWWDVPPEMLYHGILMTGQFTWSAR